MARKKDTDTQVGLEGNLGALLIEYRESAGYSVSQTADALCLSEATINKLENEEFETLAEPPYIRGYLRGYAKIAEKSPEDLVQLYETLRGAEPGELEHRFKPASSSIKRKKSLFPMLARLAIFGLIIAVLAFITMIPEVQTWFGNTWNSFTQQGNNKTNQNNNPDLIGNMPAPLPMEPNQGGAADNAKQTTNTGTKLANIDQLSTDSQNKTTSRTGTTTATTEKDNKTDASKGSKNNKDTTTATTETPSDDTIKQLEKALAEQTENTAHSKTAKIKLVFKKEVWLRIKDKNKKTVYEGQTAAGKEKELELEKPLTFRIGNAQGISIFVDGKPKDISSFINGSVANFTIE